MLKFRKNLSFSKKFYVNLYSQKIMNKSGTRLENRPHRNRLQYDYIAEFTQLGFAQLDSARLWCVTDLTKHNLGCCDTIFDENWLR